MLEIRWCHYLPVRVRVRVYNLAQTQTDPANFTRQPGPGAEYPTGLQDTEKELHIHTRPRRVDPNPQGPGPCNEIFILSAPVPKMLDPKGSHPHILCLHNLLRVWKELFYEKELSESIDKRYLYILH